MLSEMLSRLSKEYSFEAAKEFTGSKFADFVRHDLAIEARKRIPISRPDMLVKASVGQGGWASVPWLAYFDPIVTETATRGYYVVYLIDPRREVIYLSMNQGATDVYNEFGRAKGRDVLKRRASDISQRVSDHAAKFEDTAISLSSEEDLPLGYIAGHAFGRSYQAGSLDDRQFEADLEDMLAAYKSLIIRGGTTPIDIMNEESGTTDIEETRRYTLIRRIERSSRVRRAVLEEKAAICEGCELDPIKDYSYDGRLLNIPLDIHHAAPLFGLGEEETRLYRIPEDFMVLCPTCHRMIHKQSDPSDLDELKNKIRFKHMRAVSGFDFLS